MTKKINRFLADRQPQTPCLVVDLDVVAAGLHASSAGDAGSGASTMRSRPIRPREMLDLLVGSARSSTPPASTKSSGAGGGRQRRADLFRQYDQEARGHRRRTCRAASACSPSTAARSWRRSPTPRPGARVFCRILTSGDGAEWPLSRKFGCEPEMAGELCCAARELGVVPCGISFHVGSQQRDPQQWDDAVAAAAGLFRSLADAGIELDLLNIGGGFPARYRRKLPVLCAYGAAIRRAVHEHFGNRLPNVIVEPGRQMVGDAGIIQTEVLLISRKARGDDRRWVYLDIGKFGGLAETEGEAIQYPMKSRRRGKSERVILAGPTCDSADVLYETVELPAAARPLDRRQDRNQGDRRLHQHLRLGRLQRLRAAAVLLHLSLDPREPVVRS